MVPAYLFREGPPLSRLSRDASLGCRILALWAIELACRLRRQALMEDLWNRRDGYLKERRRIARRREGPPSSFPPPPLLMGATPTVWLGPVAPSTEEIDAERRHLQCAIDVLDVGDAARLVPVGPEGRPTV